MMAGNLPRLRRDVEFFPIELEGKQFILMRDPLGLVQEGKAVEISLFQFMMLLDGTTTLRDLQMALMRQRGGMLVSSDEVKSVIAQLDDCFLLESAEFSRAKDRIVAEFVSKKVRPSFHSGRAYPSDPREVKEKLDGILALQYDAQKPAGKLLALVAPHIDLSVGARIYSSAYNALKGMAPRTVIILGTGHQMAQDLYALSGKSFETPLGLSECNHELVEKLRATGRAVIARNDFAHRAEHSIEFQVLFLQHILPKDSFTIVPILCGNLQTSLPQYSRAAYREKAGPFLETFREILAKYGEGTLLVAGVDFSHIGPKFGHEMPAHYLHARSEAHDRALLRALSALDADSFWEESARVEDQYNVCGFSALACVLEVLPACRGHLLGYETWHEKATRSAVSYAAVAFAKQKQQ